MKRLDFRTSEKSSRLITLQFQDVPACFGGFFGSHIASSLYPVQIESGGVTISGYVGSPLAYLHPTRSIQFCCEFNHEIFKLIFSFSDVNGRYVKNDKIYAFLNVEYSREYSKQIAAYQLGLQGRKNFSTPEKNSGKFPVFILDLKLSPALYGEFFRNFFF
jgi:hypothetical protein